MHIASIKYCDCANGPGLRTSVFVSGCNNHCKGCFNEIAWDFDYGEFYTPRVAMRIIDSLKETQVQGITILGGEPLDVLNQSDVSDLMGAVRYHFGNTKDIWLYTGYKFNSIPVTAFTRYILDDVDAIVDGPYIEEERDISLKFRGSRNQRIINVKETLNRDFEDDIITSNSTIIKKFLEEEREPVEYVYV